LFNSQLLSKKAEALEILLFLCKNCKKLAKFFGKNEMILKALLSNVNIYCYNQVLFNNVIIHRD